MLNRAAQEMAAEIAAQDWSDAPWRLDGSRHHRVGNEATKSPRQLDSHEAENVLINVMWVTAQALLRQDPDLDLHEYAAACGASERIIFRTDGSLSAALEMGVRNFDGWDGELPERNEVNAVGFARARAHANADRRAGRTTPAWIADLAK